jgi:hypothetical protein
MKKLFALCAVLSIAIYAAEAPIRYGLKLAGADSMIFLRDGLLIVPLMLLFVLQSVAGRVHPAYWAYLAIVAVHGSISFINFHTAIPVVYGAKFLLPFLFGFIVASTLTEARGKVFTAICIIWVVTVVALTIDKFGPDNFYPWTGMKTEIGELKVDVSANWDITSGLDRRVAGLTRSSIEAAMLLPMLALIIAPRCNFLLRIFVLGATEGAIYMTTQKGAVIVFALVALVLCLPRVMWYKTLNALCLGMVALAILLPLGTQGLLIATDGGNLSLASLGMRIQLTWPQAFRWIANNEVFPFGTGLGGIGGAQRLFAADSMNPADNIFVFMYGNFGILSVAYLLWAACSGLWLPRYLRNRAHVPLSLIAQTIGYGSVLSILEGQVAMLVTGAAVGSLWLLRKEAMSSQWEDNYRSNLVAITMQAPPRDALPGNRLI